jgi:hypothetical protein
MSLRKQSRRLEMVSPFSYLGDIVSEKKRMLQFPTVARYAYGEEFSYGYSKGV